MLKTITSKAHYACGSKPQRTMLVEVNRNKNLKKFGNEGIKHLWQLFSTSDMRIPQKVEVFLLQRNAIKN